MALAVASSMQPPGTVVDSVARVCEALLAPDALDRLVEELDLATGCDAASVLVLDDGALVPVATHGLKAEASERRFRPNDHPRLRRILGGDGPVSFGDSRMPDPFDGLVEGCSAPLHDRVHACMGAPIRDSDRALVGALTIDALLPTAFDHLGRDVFGAFAALATVAMRERPSLLVPELQVACERDEVVARACCPLVGESPSMVALRKEIVSVAATDLSVLVTGETGLGKELVARALHAASRRSERPLAHVNCAALPESLIESELFGHRKGAFTGATDARIGRFESADGGTIFLDEVGQLPLAMQAKLLRVLQDGELQRVGEDRCRRVDVRVIAATNRRLSEDVAAGRFRSDLYHRLCVYPIEVPPLRARGTDVLLLASCFLEQAAERLRMPQDRWAPAFLLEPAAGRALMAWDWPGNVRELRNVMLRGAVRAASEARRGTPVVLHAAHLGLCEGAVNLDAVTRTPPAHSQLPGTSLRECVDRFQRELIEDAVQQAGGNWSEAARLLQTDRSNIRRLGRRLGLL